MERQMSTWTRIEKATTIVDVVGQIDLGSSPALRKTLLESLRGTACVAVNLVAVSYIKRGRAQRRWDAPRPLPS
jgi:anti-anti-sigma regulatory factor